MHNAVSYIYCKCISTFFIRYDISHGIPSTSKKKQATSFFCTRLALGLPLPGLYSEFRSWRTSTDQVRKSQTHPIPRSGWIGVPSRNLRTYKRIPIGERDRESDHVLGTHRCCLGRERILVVSQVLGSLHRRLDLVSRLLVDGLLHLNSFCCFMFYNY